MKIVINVHNNIDFQSSNESSDDVGFISMFSINSLPDIFLLKTIQKESLENYQKKVLNLYFFLTKI